MSSALSFNPESYLTELLWKHNIPGGSVAILENDEISTFAAGTTNIRTGQPVTPESLFLIGSITKVLTTTVLMQLVDEGEIDLHAPVANYIPDLKLSDDAATATVTVLSLLNHTNGIAGDYLDDFGRGDDAIEKYVRSLDQVPLLYPAGEAFSYSNSAFMLAGYLIERITGISWHEALQRRLLDPVGMTSTKTLPEDALRFSVGIAHRRLPSPMNGLEVGQMWKEFHAGAPAGFTPYSTPTDMVKFAQLHLLEGATPDGTRVLSSESVRAMQETTISPIPSGPFDVIGWGLGWILHNYDNDLVLGHNGGSAATLRVLRDKNFAVSVLTNAGGGVKVGQELIRTIVGEKFGLDIPQGPDAPYSNDQGDLSRFTGEYEHLAKLVRVTLEDDHLQFSTGSRDGGWDESVSLTRIGESSFSGVFQYRGNAKVGFIVPDDNSPATFAHAGLRAYRRVN